MVSNREYIDNVNNAVDEGRFNRKIRVIYTKSKPTTGGREGVASHINYRTHDRIAIWRGLARNAEEKRRREEMLRKKYGKPVHVITRGRALRHELWHVHKPYASEREVRGRLEKKPLPNKLPTRRRYKESRRQNRQNFFF